MIELAGYTSLFLSAFLAATVLPLSSEAVLAALIANDGFVLWLLVALASIGNTLGACVNWILGLYCLHWQDRKWFPVSRPALEQRHAGSPAMDNTAYCSPGFPSPVIR